MFEEISSGLNAKDCSVHAKIVSSPMTMLGDTKMVKRTVSPGQPTTEGVTSMAMKAGKFESLISSITGIPAEKSCSSYPLI